MISKKEYSTIVKNNSPKSKCFVNGTKAFFIGGFICLIGQVLTDCYSMLDLSKDDAKTLTSVTLIFRGIYLTVSGVQEKIADHGGEGTPGPIRGFANAVSTPATEFQSEGYVAGLGAKLFIIAGPVIVYGVTASVVFGAVLWVLHMFGITLF